MNATFTKYHGCGNDAILFDARELENIAFAAVAPWFDRTVRSLCHRTMGVGADVVLVLSKPAGVDADVRMRVFNSDGSEAQMCSTGVRAVAKYLHETIALRKPAYKVQTGRGVLEVRVQLSTDTVHAATIEMGEPIFEPARIPILTTGESVIQAPLPIELDRILGGPCAGGVTTRYSAVSTGNPHAVFFCPKGMIDQVPLPLIGPAIENCPLFPERTNVHFVEILATGHVRMRHWERGAGATLACGTGACATVAAGVRAGLLDRRVQADVPGGSFEVLWDASNNQLVLTGPIVEVFTGKCALGRSESCLPSVAHHASQHA